MKHILTKETKSLKEITEKLRIPQSHQFRSQFQQSNPCFRIKEIRRERWIAPS